MTGTLSLLNLKVENKVNLLPAFLKKRFHLEKLTIPNSKPGLAEMRELKMEEQKR